MNQTCQSHKTCSCALAAIDLFAKLHDLVSIYNEHARTGKLPATALEIRKEIESASEQLKRVGESCGINIEHPETFLENAMKHYEAGLLKGDIHSLSEAAEIAAEAELPLLRELWSCQEKEINEGNPYPKRLTVPEQHQLKIAKDTLKMSDVGARIMGGPTKEEAREIIKKLTGKVAKE